MKTLQQVFEKNSQILFKNNQSRFNFFFSTVVEIVYCATRLKPTIRTVVCKESFPEFAATIYYIGFDKLRVI